jgi:hypothetical protein
MECQSVIDSTPSYFDLFVTSDPAVWNMPCLVVEGGRYGTLSPARALLYLIEDGSGPRPTLGRGGSLGEPIIFRAV